MTVVVTGATGHLGRLIVESLLARGAEPTSIVAAGRQADKLAALAELGVTTASIDYSDEASLAAAFVGADSVMLVSGTEMGQRVAQHAAVITAAQAAGVGRIVYTSAPQADTSALILAPEHKATEELIRASGLGFTILRNGWYTENYLDMLDQSDASGEIAVSVGDGRVASASRADYADAAAVVLLGEGHDGATYELSGDVAWNFGDLAAAFSDILGREIPFRAISTEEHIAEMTAAGLPAGAVQFVAALDSNIRDGALEVTSGDLAQLIGRPTTPLLQGLRTARGILVG
ncbi:SDR family oxidoreductase [Leifsonia kafniensis]|uniref:SDR family oxidoreductase n=1 Tax=Leifsonia kafniensis TaxID=475957 RepID=A0ABP7KYN0_9MICO